MDQHVLSAWLLRAFGRSGPGPAVLSVYDKLLDAYDDFPATEFMTEVDAHSTEPERAISAMEAPAAEAARRLRKSTKLLPAGMYAVVGQGDSVKAAGPQVSDKGVREGMHLFVSEYQIPSPRPEDRRALANFAGLMYQRAPKTEAAIMRLGLHYDYAAQRVLDRLMPGMKSNLATDRGNTRRLHSACGEVPPAEFEAAYHQRLQATSEAA